MLSLLATAWSYICPTGVVSTLPLPQGININIGSPEIKIDVQATQENSKNEHLKSLNASVMYIIATKKAKHHVYERAQTDNVQESDDNGNTLEKITCFLHPNTIPILPKKLTVDNLQRNVVLQESTQYKHLTQHNYKDNPGLFFSCWVTTNLG
ncbi:hypothetical protein PROFUN_16757 [Planoprotostelium fungivorum]|uniref:Uncharacterized protein n=1 Tax=Planoprotostelium fungivorum TaxID=1890364 RepID=A0A2P6MNR3_9EUKA|nr:hypothetical protein PROFUN_16757 [Planoprotostelium fungivorum]